MTKALRTLSFILIFCLGGVLSAEAKPLRCEAVFQPTIFQVIEQVNNENGKYLFEGKTFEEFSNNLSWLRKRKIRKLIHEIKAGQFVSEKDVELYSIELGMALFGQRNIVDRWLFKSTEARLDQTALIRTKEQLLQDGLLKTWGEYSDPSQISVLKKALDRVKRFTSHRYGQLIFLPYYLPTIRDNRISPELLNLVVQDGFNAHAEEVRVALGRQDKIDAYNTFRRLYTPVVLGISLITHLQAAYAELERQQELQAKIAIEQLREQRGEILQNIEAAKLEILQNAYDMAYAEFIKKWGEPPTPEETIQLKTKIAEALNMDGSTLLTPEEKKAIQSKI